MTGSVFDNITTNQNVIILISVAIMLLAGFLMTRLTKLAKLPNVTAYIFAGIILGPLFRLIFKAELINIGLINGMGFIRDIALAFIAFNLGRFFKLEAFKKNGKKMVIITLFESLIAAVLAFAAMRIFFADKISFELALLLSAIASATAPASTMMTIRQTKAKGDFVDTILQVITLDNVLSLLLFSISIAVITSVDSEGPFNILTIILPLLYNLLSVGVGILLGWILHLITPPKRTKDNRLIITVAFLMGFIGITTILDISPVLGVMAMGAGYVNIGKDEELFRQIDYFSPPFLTLFFVVTGLTLRLDMLVTIGLAGVVYFLIRIVGKYIGASLGSVVAKSTVNNRKYLWLALIPQAGVSLGLAALGSEILRGHGLNNEAALLSTIIIASGVLYEIFGPPAAKLSLYLTNSYDIEKESRKKKKVLIKDLEPPIDEEKI